jgi:hypothetical protein
MLVKGVSHVEQGLAHYEQQALATKRPALQRLAKQLGQIVSPSLAELKTQPQVHGEAITQWDHR